MNNLQGILLRFWNNVVAAQGDITKMFYTVRIIEEDSWKQVSMWKFAGEDNIRLFHMVRLVMGNLFSPTLSGVCLQKTVDIGSNIEDYPEAYKAVKEDGYVDKNFLTASTKEEIQKKIDKLEFVLEQGGLHYMPFIVSVKILPTSRLVP